MRSQIEEAAKLARRVPKVQAHHDKAKVCFALPAIQQEFPHSFKQAEFDKASARVEQLEAELNGLGTITELNSRKDEITKEMRENKRKLTEYKVCLPGAVLSQGAYKSIRSCHRPKRKISTRT